MVGDDIIGNTVYHTTLLQRGLENTMQLPFLRKSSLAAHTRNTSARTSALALAALAAAALTGCANQGMSSQTFPTTGTQSVWNVEYGEVVDVRPVTVEGEISLLGLLVGSVVGSAIGAEVSDSHNAEAVGAIVGAAAGAAIEHAATSMNAQQITVDLDGGSTVAIVQDDEDRFQSGDRVRVLTANVATVHPAAMGTPGVFGIPGRVRPVGGTSVAMTRARVQPL